MYRFGYQLLTCTTFTGNQDRCVGTRYPLDRGQHIHQCLTLSNDMATVEAVIIFHRNRCCSVEHSVCITYVRTASECDRRVAEILAAFSFDMSAAEIDLIAHCFDAPADADTAISLLSAYGIPCFKYYDLDGGAGKVINGFSGYGASLYVPEAQLEEAKDLLASRPVEDEEMEDHA